MTIFGLVFSTTDMWLLGLAGALIMAWIGFLLADAQNLKTRFSQAAATFRTKVLTELEGLYPIPSNWPKDGMMINRILREKFPRLQTAVAEFRKFLPWYRRKAFDRAWFIYRMGEDGREIDIQDYWQYISHSGASMVSDVLVQHDNTGAYQENFKRNINNLLSFAKIV